LRCEQAVASLSQLLLTAELYPYPKGAPSIPPSTIILCAQMLTRKKLLSQYYVPLHRPAPFTSSPREMPRWEVGARQAAEQGIFAEQVWEAAGCQGPGSPSSCYNLPHEQTQAFLAVR